MPDVLQLGSPFIDREVGASRRTKVRASSKPTEGKQKGEPKWHPTNYYRMEEWDSERE